MARPHPLRSVLSVVVTDHDPATGATTTSAWRIDLRTATRTLAAPARTRRTEPATPAPPYHRHTPRTEPTGDPLPLGDSLAALRAAKQLLPRKAS